MITNPDEMINANMIKPKYWVFLSCLYEPDTVISNE